LGEDFGQDFVYDCVTDAEYFAPKLAVVLLELIDASRRINGAFHLTHDHILDAILLEKAAG
jgi:hypothetical protein